MLGVAGRDQVVGERDGALACHEIHVAGPARGEDRPRRAHRLGDAEAEAFGAVRREEAVGSEHERPQVAPVHSAIEKADVGRSGGGLGHLPPGRAGRFRIVRLQHEDAVGTVAERRAVRGDGGERVLARDGRAGVEHRQRDEGVRPASRNRRGRAARDRAPAPCRAPR